MICLKHEMAGMVQGLFLVELFRLMGNLSKESIKNI